MFVQLKKLLNKRISRLGSKEKVELGFIDKYWDEIISSLLDEDRRAEIILKELQSSKPVRLQNGVLTIEVKNQSISSELSLLGFELMDKINQRLGRRGVKRLFFRMKRF